MKYALLLSALLLTACVDENQSLTYQQLRDYPVDCSLKDQQLQQLKTIQTKLNFDQDPDKLSEPDRVYNSRLKATIWWYAYSCEQS
jgi:hypothetical protein